MQSIDTHAPTTIHLGLAYFWVALAYFLAIVAGIFTEIYLREYSLLWRLFWADAVATVVIFGFSVAFSNSSFYDPYWSVIPIVLALGFIYFAAAEVNVWRQIIVFLLVFAWGARLTYNWLRGWQGLSHEDWRYIDLKRQTGKAYWLVSFLGIHFLPTVLVFAGCIPLYSSLTQNTAPIGWIDGLAILLTGSAILIETIADNQLLKFKKTNQDKTKFLATGLWAYSRHPNYFGENLFWWGLFLFVFAENLDNSLMGIGALSITLLFVFISVPMIDKRMKAKRPAYALHCRKVPAIMFKFW